MKTIAQISQLIETAHQRIKPYVMHTPLKYSAYLSERYQADVYLKLENIQYTSSFKLRGACNKLLSLTPEERQLGIITASTGNHAKGVASACLQLDIKGKIVVPETISPGKLEHIRQYDIEVILHGKDSADAETYALDYAQANHLVYISPYNDYQVIAGQGTIGLEIYQDLPTVDQVYIAVGGGGLITGISSYLKTMNDQIEIIGCQPTNDAAIYHSVQAGKMLMLDNALPTLSDGTAGNVVLDTITFPYCQNYVDHYDLLSEAEIRTAMDILVKQEHLLAEFAAAMPLASLEHGKAKIKNKTLVLLLCGGNIELTDLT